MMNRYNLCFIFILAALLASNASAQETEVSGTESQQNVSQPISQEAAESKPESASAPATASASEVATENSAPLPTPAPEQAQTPVLAPTPTQTQTPALAPTPAPTQTQEQTTEKEKPDETASVVPTFEQPHIDAVSPISSPTLQKQGNVTIEKTENLLFKIENGEEIVYNKKNKLFTGALVLPDKDNVSTTYYYKNGKKNGVATSYYDNQQLRLETVYENGHKNGAEAMFAKDGNAIYQRNYKDDILDGEEILFHAGGKPRQRSFYKNGELNDKVQYFDPNGSLIKIETYKNGVKNGKEEIIENGRLKEEYNYVDGKISGIVKKYNEKYLVEEIEYKDNLPEGIGKIYQENGGVTEIPYVKGKRQGLASVFYSDNKPLQKVWYVNGLKNGINETFYKNGTTSALEYFKNGKLEGTARYFDEKGNLTTVKYYINGQEMSVIDLTKDAQLKEIYDAYNAGKLSHFSTKREYWYTILWLALNTDKKDMLQTLEKEMKMYVLSLDDMSVYMRHENFDDISRRLYFGLNPLGYTINLAAPTETLQYFISQIKDKNPRGTTALQEALRLNNADLVKYLLEKGADIEDRDEQGNTALLYALKSDAQPEIISILLQNGANVNVKDATGLKSISYALERNHEPETLLALLNNGASLFDIKLNTGETPLFHALKNKQSTEIVNSILSTLPFKTGETDAEGHSALYYALHNNYPASVINKIIELSGSTYYFEPADLLPELISQQNTELLKKLLFPIRLTTDFSEGTRSDLWYAYEHDAPQDMTDFLWERGTDRFGTDYLTTTIDNDSLLLAALRKGDKFTTMHLIDAGALKDSPQKQDIIVYALTHQIDDAITDAVIAEMEEQDLNVKIDNRPLWKHLLIGRKFNLLRKLVTKFKDLPNLQDENGMSMVELAADNPQDSGLAEFITTNAPEELLISQALDMENIVLFQFMLQKIGNVNRPDKNGQTILIKVIEARAKPEMIEMLIKNGADINYTTQTGDTAFLSACRTHQFEIAEILVNNGADVNAHANDRNCLMLISEGDDEFLNLLINNNADITYTTPDGVTVLMIAAEELNLPLISYALEHNASVNAKNADNNNVLFYLSMADKERAEDILAVLDKLLQAGVDVNNRNSNGETALMLFAKNNPEVYLAVREKLLENGAEINLKDQYGKTADNYFATK